MVFAHSKDSYLPGDLHRLISLHYLHEKRRLYNERTAMTDCSSLSTEKDHLKY